MWWRVIGFVGMGLVFALAAADRAAAQEDVWIRRALTGSCHVWGYCAERREWVRYHRPRAYRQAAYRPVGPNVNSATYVDQGPLCLTAPVRERGEEHNTINGAKVDAVRRWQATVRADYGERFMDISAAQHIVYDCHRSSTNESFAGKAAAFVGRQLEKLTGDEEDTYKKRCVVIAIPCRQPFRAVTADKGTLENLSTDEMIRELERQGYRVSGAQPVAPGTYQPRRRWFYRHIGR